MLENFFTKGQRFSRTSQSEDCETLLTIGKEADGLQDRDNSRKPIPKHCLVLLWFLSLAVAVVVGVWIGSGHFADVDKLCTEHISQYCASRLMKYANALANSNAAPVLEGVDISYNAIRFEGSLMDENGFRQSGSPEVDAAWESLGIECR
jgi:hypothetical protein